jgi:hypothetical protein
MQPENGSGSSSDGHRRYHFGIVRSISPTRSTKHRSGSLAEWWVVVMLRDCPKYSLVRVVARQIALRRRLPCGRVISDFSEVIARRGHMRSACTLSNRGWKPCCFGFLRSVSRFWQ